MGLLEEGRALFVFQACLVAVKYGEVFLFTAITQEFIDPRFHSTMLSAREDLSLCWVNCKWAVVRVETAGLIVCS